MKEVIIMVNNTKVNKVVFIYEEGITEYPKMSIKNKEIMLSELILKQTATTILCKFKKYT